jgi:hypothetical protein
MPAKDLGRGELVALHNALAAERFGRSLDQRQKDGNHTMGKPPCLKTKLEQLLFEKALLGQAE